MYDGVYPRQVREPLHTTQTLFFCDVQTTCVVQVRAVKPLTCSTKAYAGVNSVLLTGQFQSGGGKEFQRSSMEVRVRSKAEEEAACQSRGPPV